jgi:thioredoxin-like negative regulator of GroEL
MIDVMLCVGVNKDIEFLSTTMVDMKAKIAETQHLLIDFTDTTFKETIIDSGDAFIIQIRADWCGECFIMSSIVEQFVDEYSDRITFGFINVDMNEEITKYYGVTELPFLLFFNHGDLVDFLIGLHSKKRVQQYIDETISFQKNE